MKRLVRSAIDLPALYELVISAGKGGTTAFLGTVRRGEEDGPVKAIEYTAYEEMADAELERIMLEAQQRWPDSSVAAVHRLGLVPVGQASVAVVVSAPHRADAFASCRYVVEETKRRVPIWKKEIFEDGRERWRENETS